MPNMYGWNAYFAGHNSGGVNVSAGDLSRGSVDMGFHSLIALQFSGHIFNGSKKGVP